MGSYGFLWVPNGFIQVPNGFLWVQLGQYGQFSTICPLGGTRFARRYFVKEEVSVIGYNGGDNSLGLLYDSGQFGTICPVEPT